MTIEIESKIMNEVAPPTASKSNVKYDKDYDASLPESEEIEEIYWIMLLVTLLLFPFLYNFIHP